MKERQQKQEDIMVNTLNYLIGLVVALVIGPKAWISIPIIVVIALIRLGKLEDEADAEEAE